MCHFVDTAQALVGAPVEDVAALPGGAVPGAATGTTPRCRSGSRTARWLSSPTAARNRWPARSGSRSRPASHRVVINDFRSAEVDGKTVWKGRQDKGHRACVAAFRAAVAGETGLPTEAMLATMRATIRAAGGSSGHD